MNAAAQAAPVVGPRRVLHVERCMGTVFTIDIRDPGSWDPAIRAAVRLLRRADAVFSTYRADSDISRIRRGELTAADADPSVAEVLRLCARAEAETRGYFTARWPGGTDPTGLVKGWAVEEASRLLRAYGSAHHAVNGGGDVQVAGEAAPGRPWRVGIADPRDRTRTLTAVTGRDTAVATSGLTERGEHIVDPHTGRPPRGLASLTVVGPRLSCADAYATAAFAMGPAASRDWIESLDGYHAYAITETGETWQTSGFAAHIAPG